jgi:hypothetical protein
MSVRSWVSPPRSSAQLGQSLSADAGGASRVHGVAVPDPDRHDDDEDRSAHRADRRHDALPYLETRLVARPTPRGVDDEIREVAWLLCRYESLPLPLPLVPMTGVALPVARKSPAPAESVAALQPDPHGGERCGHAGEASAALDDERMTRLYDMRLGEPCPVPVVSPPLPWLAGAQRTCHTVLERPAAGLETVPSRVKVVHVQQRRTVASRDRPGPCQHGGEGRLSRPARAVDEHDRGRRAGGLPQDLRCCSIHPSDGRLRPRQLSR